MKKRFRPLLVREKKWLMQKYLSLFFSAAIFFLVCSCGEEQVENKMIKREGTTAVLMEDARLTQCYSQAIDESGQISWVPVSKDQPLHRGDLVLLLDEADNTAQVFVPNGDTPGPTYGTLPIDTLSLQAADLRKANQADASGVMASKSINGPRDEELLGLVNILSRQEGWCQIQPIAGGDTRIFWVPEDALSFNLEQNAINLQDLP